MNDFVAIREFEKKKIQKSDGTLCFNMKLRSFRLRFPAILIIFPVVKEEEEALLNKFKSITTKRKFREKLKKKNVLIYFIASYILK